LLLWATIAAALMLCAFVPLGLDDIPKRTKFAIGIAQRGSGSVDPLDGRLGGFYQHPQPLCRQRRFQCGNRGVGNGDLKLGITCDPRHGFISGQLAAQAFALFCPDIWRGAFGTKTDPPIEAVRDTSLQLIECGPRFTMADDGSSNFTLLGLSRGGLLATTAQPCQATQQISARWRCNTHVTTQVAWPDLYEATDAFGDPLGVLPGSLERLASSLIVRTFVRGFGFGIDQGLTAKTQQVCNMTGGKSDRFWHLNLPFRIYM
jgi:hypothetical protein